MGENIVTQKAWTDGEFCKNAGPDRCDFLDEHARCCLLFNEPLMIGDEIKHVRAASCNLSLPEPV